MKTKTIITIVSVFLNLVLFAVLARTTNLNNHSNESTLPAVFYIQNLPSPLISQN